MTKFVFILYVGCVLMFSAFARANELQMPFAVANAKYSAAKIEAVGFNPQTLDITFEGYLPTPCYQIPVATITKDLSQPQILVLRLSTQVKPGWCMAKIVDFSQTWNIAALAQTAGLSVDEKAIYVVKIEGYHQVMNVLGSELMRVPGFVAQ